MTIFVTLRRCARYAALRSYGLAPFVLAALQSCGARTELYAPPPDAATSPPVDDCPAGAGLFTLASGQSQPSSIAADGTSVFWVNVDNSGPAGAIVKVDHCGGPVVTLASSLYFSPISPEFGGDLALSATDVYFTTDQFELSTMLGAVVSVPKSGGSLSLVANDQKIAENVSVDATDVVWENYDGWIATAPLAGGAPRTLVSGVYPEGVVTFGGVAYWATEAGANAGDILATPLSGGATTVVASPGGGPFDLAADASGIYVVEHGGGAIVRVDYGGGAITKLAAPPNTAAGPASLTSIALDEGFVYWGGGGEVGKVPKAGGDFTVLAHGQDIYDKVAVDSTSVYWTNYDSGTVMKLTPK